MADCHLGGWRDPCLQQLNLQTFKEAIRRCISEKVDFVLFAGDIFDTALPATEILEDAVEQFRILKDSGIKCFIIAGSHDFSVSGKTFLNVIEKAGLCRNIGTVCSEENCSEEIKIFEEDFSGTRAVFSGFCGRKSSLEQAYLKKMNFSIGKTASGRNFKILALHTTLTEAKPKGLEMMESISISELPKGFDYYALGHLHLPFQHSKDGKFYVYPGPLFPNNFQELEELNYGTFVIVNVSESRINPGTFQVDIQKEILNMKEILVLKIDACNLSPMELTEKVILEFRRYANAVKDKILMLKISGILKEGKTSEVNFELIGKEAEKLGCFVLLKNIHSLSSQEFKELEIENSNRSVEEIEKGIVVKIVEEKKDAFFDLKKIQELMHALNAEKPEGQTKQVFETKIMNDISKVLNLELELGEK
jgi:DNA repair exonuclease SbcCD nuclease subunit